MGLKNVLIEGSSETLARSLLLLGYRKHFVLNQLMIILSFYLVRELLIVMGLQQILRSSFGSKSFLTKEGDLSC